MNLPRNESFPPFGDEEHWDISSFPGVYRRIINEFQWELRSSLEIFLNNGWYKRSHDWTYLLRLFDTLTGECLSYRRLDISKQADLQAKVIADCYGLWSSLTHPEPTIRCDSVSCARFDSSNYQAKVLRKTLIHIADLSQPIFETCLFAGLHGSMATLDYTGYSDIDSLVILSKESVQKPEYLLDLQRTATQICSAMYRYDPLQHHGVFFCTGFELETYPEAFLPVATLQRALNFAGVCTLEISTRDSSFEASRTFRTLSNSILSSPRSMSWRTSAGGLKGILSVFYLMPCLFLGTIGEFCYKGDSFSRMRPYLSAEALTRLCRICKIREDWDFPRIFGRAERRLYLAGMPTRLTRRICGKTTDKLFLLSLKDRWTILRSIIDVTDELLTLHRRTDKEI